MPNTCSKFKELQAELGVTNVTLSSLLGVSVATIEKRRSGKVKISKEVFIAMKALTGDNNGK